MRFFKRLIPLLLCLWLMLGTLFSTTFAAEPVEYDSESGNGYALEDYIPPSVNEILTENGDHDAGDLDFWKLVRKSIAVFLDDIIKYKYILSLCSAVVLVSAVFLAMRPEGGFSECLNVAARLLLLTVCVRALIDFLPRLTSFFTSFSELITAISASFGAVLLLDGSAMTAAASTASFAAVLVLVNRVLLTYAVPFLFFLIALYIAECLSPRLKAASFSKSLKKTLTSIFSFVFSLMITAISLQGLVASGKDTALARTVRFTASSFVPIIGSSVGEAMKTVLAGMSYLRSALGGASAYALALIILPVLLELLVFKVSLQLVSVFASLLSVSEIGEVAAGFVSFLDILLALIIAISILVFVLIILFIKSGVSII